MLFSGQQKISIAICSPHRMYLRDGQMVLDTISPLWQRARQSLSFPTNINYFELFCDGLEIGEARSMIAHRVLEHKPEPPEFLFFNDDDVLIPSDALVKLFFRARTHPRYDIYAGVYCLKRPGLPEPLIYGEKGQGPLWDWTLGDILTTESHGVQAVHMGLTLIRTSLFSRMLESGIVHGDGTNQDDEPFFKTISETKETPDGMRFRQEGTEDIYFCDKAMHIGAKILVDTSVLAGHHDKNTGITYGLPLDYGPAYRAKWMVREGASKDRQEAEQPCPECNGNRYTFPDKMLPSGGFDCSCSKCGSTGKITLKLALDLGAGGERREWDGYITYTTDLRADSNPDYVMDTRLLNLPNNHYDLVASSHHLEHIPRWEQGQVWKEIYRICKPGGRIEHVIPNIEWAARKICDNEIDQHVMNVLYGAQESHGYARELNTHYFGYTPKIAEELAKQAGFVGIEIEDWKSNPELVYHMVIRGRKPSTEEEEVISQTREICPNYTPPNGMHIEVHNDLTTTVPDLIEETLELVDDVLGNK